MNEQKLRAKLQGRGIECDCEVGDLERLIMCE